MSPQGQDLSFIRAKKQLLNKFSRKKKIPEFFFQVGDFFPEKNVVGGFCFPIMDGEMLSELMVKLCVSTRSMPWSEMGSEFGPKNYPVGCVAFGAEIFFLARKKKLPKYGLFLEFWWRHQKPQTKLPAHVLLVFGRPLPLPSMGICVEAHRPQGIQSQHISGRTAGAQRIWPFFGILAEVPRSRAPFGCISFPVLLLRGNASQFISFLHFISVHCNASSGYAGQGYK